MVVPNLLTEKMEMDFFGLARFLCAGDGIPVRNVGHDVALFDLRYLAYGARGVPTNFGFRPQAGMACYCGEENFHVVAFKTMET